MFFFKKSSQLVTPNPNKMSRAVLVHTWYSYHPEPALGSGQSPGAGGGNGHAMLSAVSDSASNSGLVSVPGVSVVCAGALRAHPGGEHVEGGLAPNWGNMNSPRDSGSERGPNGNPGGRPWSSDARGVQAAEGEVMPAPYSPVRPAAHAREGSICSARSRGSADAPRSHCCSKEGAAAVQPSVVSAAGSGQGQTVMVEQFCEMLKAQAAPGDAMVFNPKSLAFSWWGVEPKLNAWFPDRIDFWRAEGRVIAWRNLVISQLNLMVGFAVWLMWSIIVLRIQKVHDAEPTKFAFGSDPEEQDQRIYQSRLYLLPALAGLSGGTFRITNSFIILPVGGRTTIAITTLLLVVPCALTAWELSRDDPEMTVLAIAAMLSGIGGGAFASSMSNISYYFPGRTTGLALGLNGGIGNLGVSLTQICIPLMIAGVGAIGTSLDKKDPVEGDHQNQGMQGIDGSADEKVWVGAIFWIPVCFLLAIAAWLWLNDMPHHGNTSLSRRVYYYFCMQGVSAAASAVASYLLFAASDLLDSSNSARLGLIFGLVLLATILAHGTEQPCPPRVCRHQCWHVRHIHGPRPCQGVRACLCLPLALSLRFSPVCVRTCACAHLCLACVRARAPVVVRAQSATLLACPAAESGHPAH